MDIVLSFTVHFAAGATTQINSEAGQLAAVARDRVGCSMSRAIRTRPACLDERTDLGRPLGRAADDPYEGQSGGRAAPSGRRGDAGDRGVRELRGGGRGLAGGLDGAAEDALGAGQRLVGGVVDPLHGLAGEAER